mmetsp:Transcript_97161/g.251338  ORF Transcript_97161/g.251338 Transcript_97161/m.251338 type:complete len:228 (+) Transcript_97161:556-1239(+)
MSVGELCPKELSRPAQDRVVRRRAGHCRACVLPAHLVVLHVHAALKQHPRLREVLVVPHDHLARAGAVTGLGTWVEALVRFWGSDGADLLLPDEIEAPLLPCPMGHAHPHAKRAGIAFLQAEPHPVLQPVRAFEDEGAVGNLPPLLLCPCAVALGHANTASRGCRVIRQRLRDHAEAGVVVHELAAPVESPDVARVEHRLVPGPVFQKPDRTGPKLHRVRVLHLVDA